MSLYIAALFYVLTPGILLTLPKGGSKVMVAATHALVFVLVYYFTYKMVSKAIYGYEMFEDAPKKDEPEKDVKNPM